MRILGIETSCDETAISIIETKGKLDGDFHINVLANEILSQIGIHREYGGVFPMIAKREHAKNLVPLLLQALKHSDILKNIRIDRSREPELWEQFEKEIPRIAKPTIDAIAVTKGPGLEPALWTGINFAKALSATWNVPLIPINHMEGHVFASLLHRKDDVQNSATYDLRFTTFPAIALLVSGGHTELILMKDWFEYKILGATRDDAVGEAFDKVARILGLPYPGGPEISALAEISRHKTKQKLENIERISFPRPMINSGNFDFSFSGIKTSVLYFVKNLPQLTEELKTHIAAEFEEAVVEVLTKKTQRAILETGAKTLIVGGGVAANKFLRQKLSEMAKDEQAEIYISEIPHSTDNALMIATAGAIRYANFGKKITTNEFGANGGLVLT